jgi:hypothetical protein
MQGNIVYVFALEVAPVPGHLQLEGRVKTAR